MNESNFGHKIRQTLDRGLELPAGVLARLKSARALALERQQAAELSPVVALAGRVSLRLAGPTQWFAHVILPVALLLAAAFGVQQWHESQQRAQAAADLAELDVNLLKGDLPIDAYLDRNFQAWLKRSSD
jgi:hypothetical protein